MDASQYKDYVLTLLFMKYVSDKYAGRPDALIVVPDCGGFRCLMDDLMPQWRARRDELNQAPLAHEDWTY